MGIVLWRFLETPLHYVFADVLKVSQVFKLSLPSMYVIQAQDPWLFIVPLPHVVLVSGNSFFIILV